MARPSVAVHKFSSCDGCQLSLLNCEDELLAIAGEVEIANFLEDLEKSPFIEDFEHHLSNTTPFSCGAAWSVAEGRPVSCKGLLERAPLLYLASTTTAAATAGVSVANGNTPAKETRPHLWHIYPW